MRLHKKNIDNILSYLKKFYWESEIINIDYEKNIFIIRYSAYDFIIKCEIQNEVFIIQDLESGGVSINYNDLKLLNYISSLNYNCNKWCEHND